MTATIYTVQISNPELAAWLKANGAPENVLSDFILTKGCGERLELGYNGPIVTIRFHGQKDAHTPRSSDYETPCKDIVSAGDVACICE